MKIITKNILHKKLQLYSRSSELSDQFQELEKYSKKKLLRNICQAKYYLLSKKNFKKGDKVFLATTKWPKFLVWFFAILELGGAFVVSDSPGVYYKILQKRLELYGGIDHLIWSKQYQNDIFDLFGVPKEKFIDDEIYKSAPFSQNVYDYVLADEDSVVMYSTSSGTTNTPKVCSHTHKFFYDLLDRNAKIYELKDDDRCLHTKNLHHGSVIGVYLLPTLKYCSNHYWQELGTPETPLIESMFDVFKNYQINRCLFYSKDYATVFSKCVSPLDFSYSIDIFVLSPVSQEAVTQLIGKCNHKITSIFGCTETSGPLFLQKINRENSKISNNFYKPLDEFYKIELIEGILHVTMPNGELISTGDIFKIKENNFYFYGRNSGMRIKGYSIYLDLLSTYIEQYLPVKLKYGESFDLVIDKQYEKIYMRSNYEIDRNSLNKYLENIFKTDAYNISCILVSERSNFVYGIKFDAEHLRYRCRWELDIPNV